MSRDYPLSYNTPQQPAATDFWTQGGSAVLAPPSQAAAGPSVSVGNPARLSPMTKVHRLLRGRYPLAITLAAAGAVAGCVAGYMGVAPRYASIGMVTVDPRVVMPNLVQDPTLTNFSQIVGNQAGFLTSTNVAEAAMSDPAYVAAYHRAYPGQQLPDDPTFIAGLTAEKSKTASIIYATYSDKNKHVAETAAKAVMVAYQSMYGSDEAVRSVGQKLAYNQSQLTKVEDDLDAKRRERTALLSQAGGLAELTAMGTHVTEQWIQEQVALQAAQEAYDDAKRVAELHKGGNDSELVYEQIAATNDFTMQSDLAARYAARSELDSLKARGIGPAHPVYHQSYAAWQQACQRVDDYAREFVVRHPNAIAGVLPGDASGKSSLDVMKEKLDKLQAKVQADQEEAARLATAKQRVGDMDAQIGQLQNEQATLKATIAQLHDTQALTKSISVSMPGEATMQTDRRKAIAGVGLVFGGLLPVGLMMLYGLRDSRFRYSDETTEADLAGVALLGILPNLPDRLSDPQQAGIAAHCVHQIRTMLQISRANDEPQVIAVTSASTGDGKTSLTLALGLSYAACGARTLLVDCDLLAAGLTHRLNVTSPDGVLEAVANRALLEYVRTTDIADVAILPVGTTHAHHASTLSPVALRRLLSEAKKQFDIIIVDTGPILASIEASLICAAADRTILAVARNQQRPLVERSIGHLQAIGANLAGVVFNRAQARDFEKSMSGLALRSRPNPGNPAAGANSTNGTSVAKAVAGSFKRAG